MSFWSSMTPMMRAIIIGMLFAACACVGGLVVHHIHTQPTEQVATPPTASLSDEDLRILRALELHIETALTQIARYQRQIDYPTSFATPESTARNKRGVERQQELISTSEEHIRMIMTGQRELVLQQLAQRQQGTQQGNPYVLIPVSSW